MRQCPQCNIQLDDAVEICPHDGAAMDAPDPLPGRVIAGMYRIDDLLGRGGMGAVYRATQLNLERLVAVKVMLAHVSGSTVADERFKREALAVARIKHPHIVTIFDFGIESDVGAYMVMEYLDGASLEREIQARKRLPVATAIDLARQICAAVDEAHGAGLVHRD